MRKAAYTVNVDCPYLMTGDQKRRPNKEPWYSLGSGGHEENWLFWCEHWDILNPRGVWSMWGHSSWRPRGKANRRVIPQPLWQDEASPLKMSHLYEGRNYTEIIKDALQVVKIDLAYTFQTKWNKFIFLVIKPENKHCTEPVHHNQCAQ